MATAVETTTDQTPSVLPPPEARALFDRQARRLLDLSGDEFLPTPPRGVGLATSSC